MLHQLNKPRSWVSHGKKSTFSGQLLVSYFPKICLTQCSFSLLHAWLAEVDCVFWMHTVLEGTLVQYSQQPAQELASSLVQLGIFHQIRQLANQWEVVILVYCPLMQTFPKGAAAMQYNPYVKFYPPKMMQQETSENFY